MLRLLHVSDVHFGPPEEPSQVAAVERLVQRERYQAVAVSGDVSQRARAREFRKGAAWLARLRATSPVLVVPGNHDIPWWRSPLHLLGAGLLYAKYRHFLATELEPVLQVTGARLVGMNTAQGISWRTLTRRLRDLSIIGDLRPLQLARAGEAFASSPTGDLRVAVLHHNLTRGALSRRYGLKHHEAVLGALAGMGVGLVLTGHDHQEQVTPLEIDGRRLVVLTAGTISNRSRGGRPTSVFEIEVRPTTLTVVTRTWTGTSGGEDFLPSNTQCFDR
ncbi:MAG: metallophosphoesterase [Gemmatimonadaceae bacterium]